MSNETVKPMPAPVPVPATESQPTGGRSRAPLRRVTTQVPSSTPTGLPRT